MDLDLNSGYVSLESAFNHECIVKHPEPLLSN